MNASATVNKPAAKTVAANKAAKRKELEARIIDTSKPAAAKSATKTASKATPKAKAAPVKVAGKVGPIAYAVGQSCRPAAGAKLAAYSAAWMTLSGFIKGDSLPRASIAKIAGERAIAYHTGAGNFERTKDGLKLTAKGKAAFTARAVDPEMQAAYESVLKTGKENATVGVKAAHIVAMVKAA